jgi:hypothetical protein
MSKLPQYIRPVWLANIVLGALNVGSPVTVSGGSVTGYPTPTITYNITVGGVVKTWPYTLTTNDENKLVTVVPVATNPRGFTVGSAVSAVCPVPLSPPGNVTGPLYFINIATTSLKVTWAPPLTGGLPSGYVVSYRQTGSSGAWSSQSTTVNGATITGLVANTSYDFSVVATNALGTSPNPVTGSQSTLSAAIPYFPSMEVGQNMPNDTSFTTMRVFNDRGLVSNFWVYPYTGIVLPPSSRDSNGMPLTAFSYKLAEGAFAADPSTTGTWFVTYTAGAKRNVTLMTNGSIVSHTFTAGTGQITISYTAGASQVLGLNFTDGGASSFSVYDPQNSATAIAGNAVQFWNAQFLRTVHPYSYVRFMDVSGVNGDYLTQPSTSISGSISTTTGAYFYKTNINWADRPTPSAYRNSIPGSSTFGGFPIEYQLDILTKTNTSGWFNITELASDDYVTNMATAVAQGLPVGKWAGFELGNERWNTGGGFFCYRKAGYAGMQELIAGQAASFTQASSIVSFASDGVNATVVFTGTSSVTASQGTMPCFNGLQAGYTGFAPTGGIVSVAKDTSANTITVVYPCSQPSTGGAISAATVIANSGWVGWPYSEYFANMNPLSVLTFASDGVNATVVFTVPHGVTGSSNICYIPANTLNSGYTGFMPSGSKIVNVIDAYTIQYPCTQLNTNGTILANVVMQTSSFVALNGSSNLVTSGIASNVYNVSRYWHFRRAYEVAALVKAAFTAAGRPNDCRNILGLQAGDQYWYGNKAVSDFIQTVKSNPLKTVFDAVCVGGYLTLGKNGMGLKTAFGQAGTNLLQDDGVTPLATASDVLTSLRNACDKQYSSYAYTAVLAWALDQGLQVYGYEIGIDTVGANDDKNNASLLAAKVSANADPLMEGIVRDWMYAYRAMGFSKIGWYQCGAGTYSGYGCFNLGQSANEIDYTTAPSSQSNKFKGLLDSINNWASPVSRHSYPCTLSGYDCVGNEWIATVSNAWPSLSGTNLPSYKVAGYCSPNANGVTYQIWSESASTATLTVNGHTSGTGGTITVSVLGTSNTSSFVAGSNQGTAGAGVVLGTCSVILNPGANYIFISSSTSISANIYLHSLQFA